MIDLAQGRGSTRTGAKLLRRSCTAAVLLTVLSLAVPRVGHGTEAEWTYSYGKTAAQNGRWTVAARSMLNVIDAEPREKKRGLGRAYVPHFFLGLSLYELGDCNLATQSLTRSRQYGVIQKTKFFSRLEAIESSCQARSEIIQAARREIESGQQLARRFEARTDDPQLAGFWNQGHPSPIERFEEAKLGLERSAEILENGQTLELSKDPFLEARPLKEDQISESSRMAALALGRLRSLDESARKYEQETVGARTALQDDVLALRLEVLRAWNATPNRVRQSGNRDLSSEFQRLKTAHLGDADVTIDELQAVEIQLIAFLEELDDLARRQARTASEPSRQAPMRLRQAAEAYFAGDYHQVLAALDDAAFTESQELAQGHLFRAAALYALYLLGEQPDPGLLNGARSNVRSCLEVKADVEPLAAAFSPRFVDFFQQQSSMDAQR